MTRRPQGTRAWRTCAGVVLWLLCAAGCYEAHAGIGARVDAGAQPDAGAFDAGRFDADIPLDAGRRFDAGSRVDAEPVADTGPPPRCELTLLDRRPLASIDTACGNFLAPRAVARDEGSFDALLTEMRSCRDRPGEVRRERFRVVADVLVPEGVESPTVARSPGTEGAFADPTDALCGGLHMTSTDAAGGRTELQIEPDPVSTPGCPRARRCAGLAPFGDGSWVVGWDVFECDAAEFEVGRYGPSLERTGELVATTEGLAALSRMERGVAWVGRPRPEGFAILTRWLSAEEQPRPAGVRVSGHEVALAPWPFTAGFAALVSARDADGGTQVEVVLVSESGVERARFTHDAFLGPHDNFGGAVLTAAAADFGLVIGVTVYWLGGAARTSSIAFAIGADGERLGPGHRIDDELFGEGGDLAAAGEYALYARRAGEQAEVLLFGCR